MDPEEASLLPVAYPLRAHALIYLFSSVRVCKLALWLTAVTVSQRSQNGGAWAGSWEAGLFRCTKADCSLSLVMNAVINICMPLISHYVMEGLAMPSVVGGEERETELARGPGCSFHAEVCEEAQALGGGRWPLSRCYSWCQLAGPWSATFC